LLRWWENDKNQRVLEIICVLVRAVALACRGHHELVLENLALRQQLSAMRRTRTRPQLRRRDRLFWITLAQTWRHWRTALVFVQPETVVRWHRDWLRRRWTRRSAPVRPGRPGTDAGIRTLVSQMATANPVVCENSADGLRGLAAIELEHAAEPLTAAYLARSE
jgi:putative transposase